MRGGIVIADVRVADPRGSRAGTVAAIEARGLYRRSRPPSLVNTYVQREPAAGRAATRADRRAHAARRPEENYWYRRHLAVYRWIAARCARPAGGGHGLRRGLRLGGAGRVGGRGDGRRREPGSPRARPPAVRAPNLRFERGLVEQFDEGAPWDAIVFLQTIEHVDGAGPLLDGSHHCWRREASRTSALRTASRWRRPARSDRTTRGTCASTRPDEYRALVAPGVRSVELLGLFHARKLRAHELALRVGWDRVHPALRLTKPFYRRFVRRSASATSRCAPAPLERSLDLLAVCRP